MKQAIMTKPGEIIFKEVNEPGHLKASEILIRIKKIGICGSDIHVYYGEHPATSYPVIQGHEYSGIVEAVGSEVSKVTPGMKVTARPQLVCGECAPCKRGQYNVCEKLKVQGFQAPGAAQELFVVSEDRVVPIPDSVSLEQGAMIEPAAVGAHSTNRITSFTDKNVVVSGAGTVGNFVAQFAKARGAKKVLITDISNFRLNIASQCGIDATLNVKEVSFEKGVKEVFGDEGFQIGFEAAGVQASLDNLIKNIENGRDVVIIGVYAQNPTVNMYYLGEHELNMFGSMMYLHEDYETAVDFIAAGKIKTLPLLSKKFPFEQYLNAYKYIEKQGDKVMKVMIEL